VKIRFCILSFSNYKGPSPLSICMVLCYSYKQAAILQLILRYALLNGRMGSVPLHHDVNVFCMSTNIATSTTYLRGYKLEVFNSSRTEIEVCKGYVKNK